MNAQLNTRIQIKVDTENAWNLVRNTFVPLSGEMCIYRMNDGSIRSKIGDGRTAVGSLKFDDEAVRNLISSLSGTVDDLSSNVTTLSSTVSGHTASIRTLQTDLNSAESNISNLQTSLAGKANIASPTFSGVPKAPTASAGTNNTQIATTAFVKTALSGIDSGVDIKVTSTQPQGQKAGDLWYKIL